MNTARIRLIRTQHRASLALAFIYAATIGALALTGILYALTRPLDYPALHNGYTQGDIRMAEEIINQSRYSRPLDTSKIWTRSR